MPKPTFLNLTKEKQELLIKAAKKEFSRVSLYEASISNIIKDAGIPRGSFYQYFNDKDDLFFFLLEEDSKRIYELFISIIKINNGDLFKSFADWFKSILINFEVSENQQYFKNAFLNMNYKIEKTFTKNFYEEKVKTKFSELNSLLASENVNIRTEEELYHVLKIMMVVTFQNLVDVFARELPVQEAMRTFSLEIDLLKKGFFRGDQFDGNQ
jgi:AcrR family transcriptional regulator